MTKNPIINALGASAYIVVVVAVMTWISQSQGNKPDTFMAPIFMLSMLTLSVAVMAVVFFYQPLQLFIEGKKREAIALFIKTLGFFGLFTIIALVMLFLI